MPSHSPQLSGGFNYKIMSLPKGFKHTEEAKRKISEARKGKKHSEETKKKLSLAKLGNTTWRGRTHKEKSKEKIRQSLLGRKRPKEVIEKIRKSMIGKFLGEKHWNWQDGKTSLLLKIRHSFKYRQWRSDVFTRDNFICQECGYKKGHILEAHHIKKLSEIVKEYKIKTLEQALNCEELWNINNGITFCKKCHQKINK